MGRNDAKVTVYCDRKDCNEEIDIHLTALAGGGWDERNVDDELRRANWTKGPEGDICDAHEDDEEPLPGKPGEVIGDSAPPWPLSKVIR